MEDDEIIYKLKNDVDLEILTKYGFKKETTGYTKNIDNKWWDLIYISDDSRNICRLTEVVGYWETDYDVKECIKDLIDAELIEEELQ